MIKQEHKLEQLMEVWSNKEKVQAISLLKLSMHEDSDTIKVEPKVVQSYVEDAMKAGFNDKSLPDYPDDFSSAAKSMFYKEDIRKVIAELGEELHDKESTNEVLQAAWHEVEKSRNLIEFRKAFKMYVLVMRAKLYTQEDIADYTNMIDELDKEVRQLQEYKRIYNEMFEVLAMDDEETGLVLRAKQMKGSGMKDDEICRVLGINRDRLKYLRKKVKFE